MNVIHNAFKVYQATLHKYPIGVQAVQSGILMGVGDVIAQSAIEKKSFEELDGKRLLRFAGLGLFFAGPTVRIWYGVLDRMFPTAASTFAYKKVLADQFLFAPAFIAVFVSLIGATAGNSLKEIEGKLRQDYKDILITNYKLWPAVQIINFSVVPLQYQTLVVQLVAVVWNTYLSWKSNQPVVLLVKEAQT